MRRGLGDVLVIPVGGTCPDNYTYVPPAIGVPGMSQQAECFPVVGPVGTMTPDTGGEVQPTPVEPCTPYPECLSPQAPSASQGAASSGTVATSTPGASVAPAAATPAATCSLALFGDTSCIGGMIGTTTALVFGAALLALLMFGGKR